MIWKDIIGWEGIYQINRKGQVRSLPRPRKSTDGSVYFTNGRILKSFFAGAGYLFYPFVKDGKNYTNYVHRLVAIHFKKNPFNLPEVNHDNGIKTDNRIGNLKWVSRLKNMQHANRTGLFPQGEERYNAKLKTKQVIEILKIKNKSHSQIARMYNVAPATIRNIVIRKSWKHV